MQVRLQFMGMLHLPERAFRVRAVRDLCARAHGLL